MRYYNKELKVTAQRLRREMTESERKLWIHLRNKQMNGIQFYRQKILGNYIVDFYAPKVNLVIEVDGGQHFEPQHKKKDRLRDEVLNTQGLQVLRFTNAAILQETEGVLKIIFNYITTYMESGSNPPTPFSKGGNLDLKLCAL